MNALRLQFKEAAEEYGERYQRLLQAAKDYPYRDMKNEWIELVANWPDVPAGFVLPVLYRIEEEMLGRWGKLGNIFPLGHPRAL